METRGKMGFVNKLVFWIIPLIFLIIIVVAFFGEESLFDSVKRVVKGITSIVPEVGIGAQTTPGEKPVLPADHKAAINSLRETMEAMKGKENCVAQYKPKLPPLGKPGTSIVFEKAPVGYHVIIKGGKEGVQDILDEAFDLNDIHLCVIAGDLVAQSFYVSALTSDQGKPTFKEINALSISFDSENRIQYDGGNSELRDNGWLYTPGENNICFFPTMDSSLEDYNNLGLHQKFLEGTGEGSVQYALSRTLRLCSQAEEEWTTYNSIELFADNTEEVESLKIRQACSGFVGTTECPAEDNDCNGKFPTEIGAGASGCLVMISEDDFLGNNCGWEEAEDGQIMTSTREGSLPDDAGNIRAVFFSGDTDAEELFSRKIWRTFPGRSLVCNNKQWIECTEQQAGKVYSNNGRTYLCINERQTQWVSVMDEDNDLISESHFTTLCGAGEMKECLDNCPNTSNPLQEDKDKDTIGDACDACPEVESNVVETTIGTIHWRQAAGCVDTNLDGTADTEVRK